MEYPIVPEIKAEIKFVTGVFLKDIFILGGTMGVAFIFSNAFPAEQIKQQVIFMVLAGVLAIYWDLRPKSNPGKRNLEIIWQLITDRSSERYKSFNAYEFLSRSEINKLFEEQK